MRIEVVSIGTELLVSDILDTNAAYISRSLREANLNLTCKVTVGDEPELIVDAIQVGLRRADVVLTTGGLGAGANDFTRHALARLLKRPLQDELPGVEGATLIGNLNSKAFGLIVELPDGLVISLPGHRQEMAYLLETEVLPLLKRRMPSETSSDWVLLRTVGLLESVLKEQLVDLMMGHDHQISFDSYAGQTNIKIWAKGETEAEIERRLAELKQAIIERLGDHVYGEEDDRLEDVILQRLLQGGYQVAIAECYTGRVLSRCLESVPGHQKAAVFLGTTTWSDLVQALHLQQINPEDDLTRWCREAAERLRTELETDLGLIVYNHITQGGIQVLVTLASPYGVSVTQRTFGGHPENINQWASTLGLTHLYRWLLAHTARPK